VLQEHINPLVELHANYAAIMPFGFVRNMGSPEILYDSERQWFGETRKGVKQYIEMLHKNNIRVLLKPHLWISHGEFTGYLKMNNEETWEQLETGYRDFILSYAEVAAQTGVAIFCIGTELEQFITHRPAFWLELIAEVRGIYSGELTYAANWDEYKRVPFWDRLDYIGIDAYFPVSESKTPTIAEAGIGWQQWKKEMAGVATSFNKQIIFTEVGYRSMDFAGKEPWKSERGEAAANMEAQSNLTAALLEELWKEPWFSGGFIWKWYIDHETSGGIENNRFTPQNKPAELVIRNAFQKQ
jgi:hypothetical protein